MARTDTLANFVTDVANAIRTKSGKSDLISPSNFDNEIINLPSGGGGAEPNIFIQDEEPNIKEGLWIKSADIQVDKTVVDENVFVAEEWMDPTLIGKVHTSSTGSMSCAVVGDYLYLTGAVSSETPIYKVNLNDYTVEQLPKTGYKLVGKQAFVIGTDIYYIGNRTSYIIDTRVMLLKYDTTNNTMTRLADLPYITNYYSKAVLYNNHIYLFCAGDSSAQTGVHQYRHTMKYSIENDEWTELAEYPKWYPGSTDAILLGDKVWILFAPNYANSTSSTISDSSYVRCLVFDLSTETYIDPNTTFTTTGLGSGVTSKPRVFVVDSFVYILTILGIYKVPVSTFKIAEKATKINLPDYELIPNPDFWGSNTSNMYYMSLFVANNKLYISGHYYNTNYDAMVFALTSKEFNNNTLVIRQGNSNGGAVLTQLFNLPLQKGRLTYPLYNAIHYTTENGANNSLPLYYGTGTEWVKFKN